jgi:hypothetical protein
MKPILSFDDYRVLNDIILEAHNRSNNVRIDLLVKLKKLQDSERLKQ